MSRHDLAQSGPVVSVSPQPTGYGKPPAATQWKPGQSGNPKGRPKGESLGDIFRRIASGPAEARKSGQPADTEMGHLIRRLFTRVSSYSFPAETKMILALGREYLPEREEEETQDTAPAINADPRPES